MIHLNVTQKVNNDIWLKCIEYGILLHADSNLASCCAIAVVEIQILTYLLWILTYILCPRFWPRFCPTYSAPYSEPQLPGDLFYKFRFLHVNCSKEVLCSWWTFNKHCIDHILKQGDIYINISFHQICFHSPRYWDNGMAINILGVKEFSKQIFFPGNPFRIFFFPLWSL